MKLRYKISHAIEYSVAGWSWSATLVVLAAATTTCVQGATTDAAKQLSPQQQAPAGKSPFSNPLDFGLIIDTFIGVLPEIKEIFQNFTQPEMEAFRHSLKFLFPTLRVVLESQHGPVSHKDNDTLSEFESLLDFALASLVEGEAADPAADRGDFLPDYTHLIENPETNSALVDDVALSDSLSTQSKLLDSLQMKKPQLKTPVADEVKLSPDTLRLTSTSEHSDLRTTTVTSPFALLFQNLSEQSQSETTSTGSPFAFLFSDSPKQNESSTSTTSRPTFAFSSLTSPKQSDWRTTTARHPFSFSSLTSPKESDSKITTTGRSPFSSSSLTSPKESDPRTTTTDRSPISSPTLGTKTDRSPFSFLSPTLPKEDSRTPTTARSPFAHPFSSISKHSDSETTTIRSPFSFLLLSSEENDSRTTRRRPSYSRTIPEIGKPVIPSHFRTITHSPIPTERYRFQIANSPEKHIRTKNIRVAAPRARLAKAIGSQVKDTGVTASPAIKRRHTPSRLLRQQFIGKVQATTEDPAASSRLSPSHKFGVRMEERRAAGGNFKNRRLRVRRRRKN